MPGSECDFREVSPEEEEAIMTKRAVNALVKKILKSWSASHGDLNFPQAVQFNNGALSSLSKRAAAGALETGIRKGEILIAVTLDYTGPLFEASTFIPSNAEEEETIPAAFLPRNFEARCIADGVEPEGAIGRSLEKLIYLDTKLEAERVKRVAIPPRSDSLVRIFKGKLE